MRSDYKCFVTIPTRWMDNDVYGHVNNVQYYSFFDTAVNQHLIENGVLDIHQSPIIGIVVDTQCTFKKELKFPETLEVGLAMEKLGNSSATYRIEIFKKGENEPAAQGRFVHVYVDRETRKPVEIPGPVRSLLEGLT